MNWCIVFSLGEREPPAIASTLRLPLVADIHQLASYEEEELSSVLDHGRRARGIPLRPPGPAIPLRLPRLPPTPPHDYPAAFDDMVLPYIARLLMDEEAVGEDNFFYQYPDHHEP